MSATHGGDPALAVSRDWCADTLATVATVTTGKSTSHSLACTWEGSVQCLTWVLKHVLDISSQDALILR